jgi:hypothetical protein
VSDDFPRTDAFHVLHVVRPPQPPATRKFAK